MSAYPGIGQPASPVAGRAPNAEDPATASLPGRVRNPYGKGAVDPLDVAAELESSGFSERLSRIHLDGRGIFEIAEILFRMRRGERFAPPAPTLLDRHTMRTAIARGMGLIGGLALIASTYAVVSVGVHSLAMVAFLAWINGQNAAAIVWARHGRGELGRGLRIGWRWGLSSVVLSIPIGLCFAIACGEEPSLVLALLIAVVQLYAVSVSVLSATSAAPAGALAVIVAGVLAVVLARTSSTALLAAVPVVVVTGFLVLLVMRHMRNSPAKAGLDWEDLRAIPPALTQAVLLAMAVFVVLAATRNLDDLVFVLGSVVVVAAADPLLVLCRWGLRAAAERTVAFQATAMRAVLVVSGTVIAAVAVGLVVSAAILIMGIGEPRTVIETTLVIEAAYSLIAVLSATLRTFGAPWAAVFAVLPATCALVVFAMIGAPWATMTLIAGILIAVVVLFFVLRDPRAYL